MAYGNDKGSLKQSMYQPCLALHVVSELEGTDHDYVNVVKDAPTVEEVCAPIMKCPLMTTIIVLHNLTCSIWGTSSV